MGTNGAPAARAAQRLTGKVAVVTGGGRGIGRAVAVRLRDEGARVAVSGRSEQTLAAARATIGPDLLTVSGDATRPQDLDRLFATVRDELGRVDVLIANAAVQGTQPFTEVTEDSSDQQTAGVLRSAFFTVQRAVPSLANPASVVLVGSTGAAQGHPGNEVYAAAKAGVRSLARGLSADLVDRGVRVNCLSPGIVDTEGLDIAAQDPAAGALLDGARAAVPLGRFARPEEIAAAAAFLASDDSSYMLGSELVVDGGATQL